MNLSTLQVEIWQYEFEPQHIAGRNNVISDALSRVTPLEFQDTNADKDILAVNFLQYSSIEEREKDEVLQETLKDKELQSLKQYISTGWASKRIHRIQFLFQRHYFLYGRKFILQTDQTPLVSIFRKHMIDVSPRIQRITIRAWQYEFEPQHIAGRNNVIYDALSRVTPLEFEGFLL